MLQTTSRTAWSILIACVLLAGCSNGEDPMPTPRGEPQEFSEEDKAVARALSISNNQAVADADSPYARALLCSNGMEALAERFQQAGGLGREQRQSIVQARQYFDQQLRALGEGEGKSTSDVDDDLEQTAQDNPDPAENALIAIACLRRLQEAG